MKSCSLSVRYVFTINEDTQERFVNSMKIPMNCNRKSMSYCIKHKENNYSTISYPPWLFHIWDPKIWGSGCQSPHEWMIHCSFIRFKENVELNWIYPISQTFHNNVTCERWRPKFCFFTLEWIFPKTYEKITSRFVINYAVTRTSPAYLLSCKTNQLLLNILRSEPVRSTLEHFFFAK